MSDDNRSQDEGTALSDDGRVQLTRRPLPDRAHRIADDLAGIAHELRDGNAGTSDQRLRLAAAIVSMRMLGDDLREQLAAANERAEMAWAAMATLRKLQAVWDREHDQAMAAIESHADMVVNELRARNAELRARLDALGEATQFRLCQSPHGPLVDWTDIVVGECTWAEPWPGSAGGVRLEFRTAPRPTPDAAADGHSATQAGCDRHSETTTTPDGTGTETTHA